jgi:hypothetical protein
MYIGMYIPEQGDMMSLPYIYMFTACGNHVPWLASQTDLLADDWQLVESLGVSHTVEFKPIVIQ